jgi:hypothetical protein
LSSLWKEIKPTFRERVGKEEPEALVDTFAVQPSVRAAVAAPMVLSPTGADVWYAKLFLDETAEWANGRVAARVAQLLTSLHAGDPTLFTPQQRADDVAKLFRVQVNIAGATGNP